VVSFRPSGSAVMMWTGGIESDDGKNNSPFGRGAAGDAEAAAACGSGAPGVAGRALAVGPAAAAGQTD
jgi:hypothetical protein